MITLTATNTITSRGASISLVGNDLLDTGIRFGGELKPILTDGSIGVYLQSGMMVNRRVTPPILMQLISNLGFNMLVKFKDRDYIIGKNLIFTYDVTTGGAVPMMVHLVKGIRTLREGKIVINPALFEIDSTFYKMFQTILQTGVDIELTRFIEDKYYLSLDLPKFGTPGERRDYLEKVKTEVLAKLKSEKDEKPKTKKQGVPEW